MTTTRCALLKRCRRGCAGAHRRAIAARSKPELKRRVAAGRRVPSSAACPPPHGLLSRSVLYGWGDIIVAAGGVAGQLQATPSHLVKWACSFAGVRRTGKMLCSEWDGIKPDITILGGCLGPWFLLC